SQSKGVGNCVVIKDIVEDNVVSRSGNDSMLTLEWPERGKEEVVFRSGKGSRLLMFESLEMGE
ncbi:hypothetical protein Tco_0776393, partial [Tanacetum coccineum]